MLALSLSFWGCTAEVGSSGTLSGFQGQPGAAGSVPSSSGSAPNGSGGSGGGGVANGATATDLPCDVQRLLAQKCQVCHKANPPGSLLRSADFRAASRTDPSKTLGQEALERVQATGVERMPPAPAEAISAAEIAALSSWVAAGALGTGCAAAEPVAADPYDTPVVCTSNTRWTRGDDESPEMHPGRACITCHEEEDEGPELAVGGTVFPTPHEPDDCNGVSGQSGARVVITDANGTEHNLSVNDAGNFLLETDNFAYPYQAKVVYQGRERVMVEKQDDGDCNNCHTEAGRENAPGRIFLP